MRSARTFGAVCAAAVLAASAVAIAGALISSTSASVVRLASAPPSVALNALENATTVVAFDEKQATTLASAVTVDAVNPGTFTSFPSGSATVAAGTVVDSHLIHSDIPSRHYTSHRTGSVTFNANIVGAIASTSRLAASDTALGASGTTYAGTTTYRGLEGSREGTSSLTDRFVISADRRTVTFDVQTLVMDEIRVLTAHVNPLTTAISQTPNPVQAGDDVTYTITVTNTGGSTAADVTVADEFPDATLVSATSSGGCTGTTTVTCALGSIAAGGSAVATVVVKSPSTVPSGGQLTNRASAPAGQTPFTTVNTSVVSPALDTTISDSPDPVTAGNNVQYTLTVTNHGIAPVADAHVINTLPTGTTLVVADASGGCTGTGPVDCSLGSLAVNASAVAHVVVTSPAAVPDGGTITNSAVASPGANATTSETTTVETPQAGVSKGFVLPGGSITIPGDNPATITLPNTGDGAPVVITQGDGTFCDGSCTGPATTISEFGGYSDPANPIHLTLTYEFPDSPTSLTDAATAFGATIYKNDDPFNPTVGTAVPACATPGSGVAAPHPCIDAHSITQPTFNSFVVTFEILYISGDPRFARK